MIKQNEKLTPFHVEVSSEAIAAGQFARLGYDVSVQYGANQPEYDLIISKGDDKLYFVSVKGSQDGSWGLTQNFLTKGKADYKDAIDKWLQKHSSKTIFCFVQLQNVPIDILPRMYLATPKEVAKRLKETANNNGATILYENHTWTRKNAMGIGTIDKIPDSWKFSKERIEQLTK